MVQKIDLTGHVYGRFLVLHEGTKRGKNTYWVCKCDCGTIKEVHGGSLRYGSSVSCGCFKDEVQRKRLTTHGQTSNSGFRTRLYGIWASMKTRCTNPKGDFYDMYGGKGIKVCSEWEQFATFMEWAISNGYSEELTIDRVNSDKHYCPENCRWTTNEIQTRNRQVFKNSASGFTGVHWNKVTSTWNVTITVNKKNIRIGTTYTKEDGAKLRNSYIINNNLEGFKLADL